MFDFNVTSEWMIGDSLRIQTIEFTDKSLKDCDAHAARLCFLDSKTGNEVVCVTMGPMLVMEFAAKMSEAAFSVVQHC